MQVFCYLKDLNLIDNIAGKFKEHDVWNVSSIEKLLYFVKREYDFTKSEIVIISDIENKNSIDDLFQDYYKYYIGESQDINVLKQESLFDTLPLVFNYIQSETNLKKLTDNVFNCFEEYMDLEYYCKISPDIKPILDCKSKNIFISHGINLMQEELCKYLSVRNKRAYKILDASQYKDIEILKILFGEAKRELTTNGLCHNKNFTVVIKNFDKINVFTKRKLYYLMTTGSFTRFEGQYACLSDVRFILLSEKPIDDDSNILLKPIVSSFHIRPINLWSSDLKFLIFSFFIKKYSTTSKEISYSEKSVDYLSSYKGNYNIVEIKEIASSIARHLGKDSHVQLKHIPSDVVREVEEKPVDETLKLITDYNIYNLDDLTKIVMFSAFKKCYFSPKATAEELGISYAKWRWNLSHYNMKSTDMKNGIDVLTELKEKYHKINRG